MERDRETERDTERETETDTEREIHFMSSVTPEQQFSTCGLEKALISGGLRNRDIAQ